MCAVCRKNPCDPRCPNAEPQQSTPVYTCDICGKGIFVDEYYFKADDGELFCEDCLDDFLREMPPSDILDLFGKSLDRAQ